MADGLAGAGRSGEILARVGALVAPKSGADLRRRKRMLTSAQAALLDTRFDEGEAGGAFRAINIQAFT